MGGRAFRPTDIGAGRWFTFATAVVCAMYGLAETQEDRALGPLAADGTVTYFIAEGEPSSAYRKSDAELAHWALDAWERNGNGAAFHFVEGPEDSALVRVYWVPAGFGEYGEMRRILVKGRRGAAVFIRPDTDALGREIGRRARADELYRDTIVYPFDLEA